MLERSGPWLLDRGDGALLYDADGREYLDALSGGVFGHRCELDLTFPGCGLTCARTIEQAILGADPPRTRSERPNRKICPAHAAGPAPARITAKPQPPQRLSAAATRTPCRHWTL